MCTHLGVNVYRFGSKFVLLCTDLGVNNFPNVYRFGSEVINIYPLS